MGPRRDDEYGEHAHTLADFAGLDPSHPRRAHLLDDLVAAFLPLARHIARRFARRGEPVEDLEQVACIGLLHALERFDPGRERDFLSYAVPTITGEVRRYFRDHGWTVRTPRAVKERYLAVGAGTTRLAQRLGRAPTVSELAEHLELDREQVAEAVTAHGSLQPTSLDAPFTANEDAGHTTLADTLVAEDLDLDNVERRAILHRLVRSLPERERRMLVLRFVHDRTQTEIARDLCVSQMHVSRLLGRTLALLRTQAGVATDEGALLPAG